MDVRDRVAIVTGGGAGIGRAVALSLARHGARVVVADLNAAGAETVAAEICAQHPGAAVAAGGDVSSPEVIAGLIARAEAEFGPVDLYFANAGIPGGTGFGDEHAWDLAFAVNVSAHVRAARALLPGWLARGEGYFVSTASAAGLLTQIGSAPYAVSKHAAVGFAEWLSVTYHDQGIRVSCLCPMGVRTQLLESGFDDSDQGDSGPMNAQDRTQANIAARAVTTAGAVLEPDDVAELVLDAIAAEQFLILPHPEVLNYFRHKGSDYDRWLAGMRRHQARLQG